MTNLATFTLDDISRLFAAVASMVDANRSLQFDPETQRVIAVVRTLVTAVPTADGPGHWSSQVAPFVIQAPLPEMPQPPRLTVVPDTDDGSAR